ncbi:MAG: general stress protein [Alphaproteobacteria bacterium]|nr:general stress protein [Alphaproteobacteria bacterium]
MTDTLNTPEARKKVWELIKDIRIAQLVTHVNSETLAARPMYAMNKDFDGNLWFFTDASSPKVDEVKAHSHVLLSYSDPSKNNYVSIQGHATISDDREKIAELWSEGARAWFPKGEKDENLRLLRVVVNRAEYWDSPSSTLVMAYGYAYARLTGETPKVGENKKVAFR